MSDLESESSITASLECPGTFRWAEDKKYVSLPPYPSHAPVDYLNGWGSYLFSRGGASLVHAAKTDPALLDCLSFPVTLVRCMELLGLEPGPSMSVVIIGASRRAEERVARSTRVWDELAHRFPTTRISLYFVGPEMSKTGPISCKIEGAVSRRVTCLGFKGGFLDFARSHPDVVTALDSTIFIAFNGGFGNFAESGNFSLLWSWAADLHNLVTTGGNCFFTCANDYGDVRGEVAVMKLLGGECAGRGIINGECSLAIRTLFLFCIFFILALTRLSSPQPVSPWSQTQILRTSRPRSSARTNLLTVCADQR